MKRAETCSCPLFNKFYTYPYHHIVVLDKYINSNPIYYKHNGDNEPYNYTTFMCCVSRSCGSLNLLGPVQDCIGFALLLHFFEFMETKRYRVIVFAFRLFFSMCHKHRGESKRDSNCTIYCSVWSWLFVFIGWTKMQIQERHICCNRRFGTRCGWVVSSSPQPLYIPLMTSLPISEWGWLDPRLDVDISEKRKISSLWGESKPDFSSVYTVA